MEKSTMQATESQPHWQTGRSIDGPEEFWLCPSSIARSTAKFGIIRVVSTDISPRSTCSREYSYGCLLAHRHYVVEKEETNPPNKNLETWPAEASVARPITKAADQTLTGIR